MAKNTINYLNRDFNSVRADIINYSKTNYPQLSDNFGNDSSISSWIIDLLSDTVDSLNYHIDRTFQDTQLNTTTSKSALMNLARSNGLKVPGPKAGLCEVQFSCVLPAGYLENGHVDISQPNWNAAPLIQRNCVIGAGNLSYTIEENVDFSEQFNSNAFSNRSYTPRRSANGEVTGYTVTKSVLAVAGAKKIYKRVLSSDDIKPFMELILPEKGVMNIESVIFKSSNNLSVTPEISEFYVDEEEYRFKESAISTYRYFEVDSLADQWRWGSYMSNMDNDLIYDKYNPEQYVDYTENISSGNSFSQRTTRIYRGQWKPLRQKFITEYTDNGYMKVIFGPGVDYNEFPSDASSYAQYRMSSIMNNDMLGVLPKAGWTMYVLYNVGGGIETNIAPGAINTIRTMQVDFPNKGADANITVNLRSSILKTISVKNLTVGVTGKNGPSTEELKNYIKYNTGAQNRCVTLKDYQIKVMEMPPKYGAPFRCSVTEENNKIVFSVLGIDSNGALYKAIPNTLAENIEEYMSHYKNIGDYIELKSGKIYNIGFMIDAFIDKSYNSADVVANIISTVKDYMDINKIDMGEDIFIGDLNKELTSLDGVISLIDLKVYKINGGGYSNDVCPLPSIADTGYSDCKNSESEPFIINGATCERIDLDSIDSVLLGDNGAMYELKNSSYDIQVRIKTK